MSRFSDEFVNMASPFLSQQHALPWKAAVATALLVCCVVRGPLLAQEKEPAKRPTILLLKTTVLKERVSEVDGEFIPVRREEFEKRIKTIRSREIAPDAPLDARIAQAAYSARVVNNELVDGTAELAIIHSAGKPVLVPMSPCGLALEGLVWKADDTEAASEETVSETPAAKVGLDDAGRLIAVLETSGVLQFNWSLRGQRETPDELAFDLQLPASPVSRLKLDVPNGFEPTVQKGIVSEDSDSPDHEGYSQWLIELGGNNSTLLRIVPSDGEEEVQRLVFLREQTTYRPSQTGVEVLVDLRLDVQNESLTQLTVTLDEALQLLAASYADAKVNWTESLSDGGRKVVLELPEPILGIDRTIQLRAVAPITPAQSWELPRVAVEGAIWLEGGATLEVPPSLALEHLAVVGGRQTRVVRGANSDDRESVQIQYFKPDSVARAIVRPHEGMVIVRQGTTVKVGPTSVNAIHVADFVSTGSQRFALEMETSSNWTIDLITTDPPDLIDEWSTKAGRVEQLRLREPLPLDRPLRVTVHGHRRGMTANSRLESQDLRFCVFRGVMIERSIVAIGAESPYQVRLSGDADLARMGSTELTDLEGEQVTWQAGGVAYVDGPAADNLIIEFSTDPPKFAADVRIQSDVGGSEIAHAYRVRCVPESSSIDRVLIHFSHPSETELRWLLNDDDEALTARRLTPEEQQQAGTHGGETWEVALPNQQDAPFDLTARRTAAFGSESPIPLVTVPRAASQAGSVTIRSPETVPIAIQQTNLKPIPAVPPDAGKYATTRGVFRYEQSQLGPLSVIRQTSDALGHDAWIWSCQVVSRFSSDGQTTHEVVYRLENRGAVQLELKPPRNCEFLEASVDDREIPLPADVSADSNLTIPLPRGVRFPTVVLRFVAEAAPLSSMCDVSAPWPKTNLSVFRREWTVWLPPGVKPLGHNAKQADAGWRRRLFGPLLRTEDHGPFNPFSEYHWRSLGVDADAHEENLLGQAEAFLRDLAQQWNALHDATDEGVQVTWGKLLTSCEQSRQQPDGTSLPPVRIDRDGLAQMGINARSPVDSLPMPFETAAIHTSRDVGCGVNLLEHANLALISHNDGLLLTTADALSRREDSSTTARHRCIAVAAGAQLLTPIPPTGPDLRVVPIRAWTIHPPLPQECWRAIPRQSMAGVANAGWNVSIIPISSRQIAEEGGNRVTHLRIHKPQAIHALAWAAFLTTLGLVWWMIRRWILLGIPLTAIAGLAALFAPEGLTALSSACFLGALSAACLAVAFPRGKRRVSRRIASDSESQTSSALVEAAGVGIVATIAWMNIPSAEAQEAAAPKPPAPVEIHQVLFPVDEAGQPSGDYVFVPPELLKALHWESPVGSIAGRKWMICAADYRAVLDWDVSKHELVATELVANFEVEVPQPKTNIVFPFEQEQVHLLPNGAQVNGQTASVSWLPGGKGLSVEVAQPGTCKLDLAFRPRVNHAEDYAEFHLGIPRVPLSQLRVELPDEAKGVEFPSAVGTLLDEDETGMQVVRLGPTDRLSIRWPKDPDVSSVSTALSVDQLTWLKVGPGSVVLDAKLKFTTSSGTIDRVQLLADPRLKMFELGPDHPTAGAHQSTERGVQTIWFDIKPPLGREVAFDVSFALTGSWGVGNVRIPRLEAVADRSERRWLAVSVADDLEFKPLKSTDDSPSSDEFFAAWGPSEVAPQIVTQEPKGQADWMLTTWPRKPATTAVQRLGVSVGRSKAEFQLDADIEIADGSRFQHRVLAPRSVQVTDVSLVQGDTKRTASWYHDAKEGVVVRLDGPITGTHHLQLLGEIPIRPNNANLRLPRISLADATLTADSVDLYRQSQVQVDLVNKGGFADVAGAKLGTRREGWGRLVAALEVPDNSSRPTTIQARLRPNRPEVAARLVITLGRKDGVWQAEADCDFRAAKGIIDAIRLETPPEWSGPFELDSETELEIVEVPDQNRRQLVIAPPQAIDKSYRVRVRGALSASAGEQIRAPDIVPLDVVKADRYLIVPTQVQRQQIAWETSGVQEAPLPSGYQSNLESFVSYVVGDRFRATITDVQAESGIEASVRLADVHADVSNDGSILGLATFDLEPAGRSECVLALPVGYELVRVTVGNLPAQLDRMKGNRWRFRLGPRQLPQQVQVLFTGTLQPVQWRQQTAIVQSPQLDGIPVESTLWTVRGPSTGDMKLLADDSILDPLSHEKLRLDRTSALIEAAVDAVTDSDSVQISNWYRPWTRRLTASLGRATQWHVVQPGQRDPSDSLGAYKTKQKEIATRLGVETPEAQSESDYLRITEPADVWRVASSRPMPTRRWAFDGKRETIEFRQSRDMESNSAERWATVTILLGVTVICLFLLPGPLLECCLRRCPQLLGIPLGIIWWLWLVPSVLGLIVMILAGLGSIIPLLRLARS